MLAVRFIRSLSSKESAANNSLPNAASRMNAATDSRAALAFCSTTAYSTSLNCISLRLVRLFSYSLCGYKNHMSPDDHYADLKRVIAAAAACAYSGNCRLNDKFGYTFH